MFFVFDVNFKVQATPIESPCASMPCGLNSQCRELNDHAVCSCLPDMIGAPPNCRPECLVSSECPLDRSCVNQKCKNPCEGVCGLHARCVVVNHNPICSCELGFNGDPFVRCVKEEKRKKNQFRQFVPSLMGYSRNNLSKSFVRLSNRSYCSSWLCTNTVWTELAMSWSRRISCMFMFAELHWACAKLPSWMYYKFWMCSKFCVYKRTLCWPLHWNLLVAGYMQCIQSSSGLPLSRSIHRRSVCCLHSNSK